jgi:ubiquinone/menaquinone biosynthesis C-methylase UbiE
VITELLFLRRNYNPDHIWFCDDIFGLKPGWVNHFAELVNESGIKLRYKIQSRVDLLLQENNIEALARSGCETTWVGAESGSQSVLDAMDKGTTVNQIRESTLLLKKYGIKPAFFLQFGYPGETRDDIRATIRMVKQLLPDDIGISVSYPLPGTPFYERVKSELLTKSNWTDSDDLALLFQNTFPPGFYRHLHRYVHKTYRIHQGIDRLKQSFTGKNKFSFRKTAGIVYHLPGAFYHGMRMRSFRELPQNDQNNKSGDPRKVFDSVAERYDTDFTNTDVGRLQRGIVHRLLRRKIDPSQYNRVLEINCGTGEDALWMARQGFSVSATDISGEMIRIAGEKASATALKNPPDFSRLSFSDISTDQENTYDLVFSNFGGLNCAGPDELHQVAIKLNKILRPGGKFIAVVMGKKCLSEKIYFTLKNSAQKHRRTNNSPVAASFQSGSFPVWYYSPKEFSELFKPWFNSPVCKPVGFFIPPSWLNGYFSRSGPVRAAAVQLEKMITHVPALSDYADHYYIELTRK